MSILNPTNGTTAAIRYDVVKNYSQSKLQGRDVYCSKVQATPLSLATVADTMVREGCKYETNEVVSILEKFASVATRLLQEGNAINLGSLVRFRPSIRGKFETIDEAFSKAKHRIVVNASVGSALRNVAVSASVSRITAMPLPEIHTTYNGLTGNPNSVASQGPLIVMGKHFIWNEAAEDEGFFTDAAGEYRACELTSLDAARQTAFLHIVHELEAGATVKLYFSTRNTSNGERVVIDYDVPITCEVNPDADSTEG